MHRPTVLHVMRAWGVPSETFVRNLIHTTAATRPVVICGSRASGQSSPVRVPVLSLNRIVGRLPLRRQDVARILIAGSLYRPAVLHTHFGQWAPASRDAARILRKPWMVSLHGADLLVEAPPDPSAAGFISADLVVVPSRFLAARATAAGVAEERIRVIPSGVDLAAHPFRERRPRSDGTVVISFVGRFVEKKGPVAAAAALVDVAREHPEARIRFVGYGPLEAAVRAALAPAMDVAVVVDGRRPAAAAEVLDETDLLISPSHVSKDGDAETLCVVNLEAQARGIPVVTTDHGGIPEGVAPDSAVIVPEGDQRSLVQAVSALLMHPERWPLMGLVGRRFVSANFELGARTAEIEQQYLALATGTEPPPSRST